MLHNKRRYVKKINKSAAQGSRRVDLMFKQASQKAFTSDFDVCDKDLGPGRVTQSVTCLATDACLTADHETISTVILLPSADSFKKGCCQLQAKVCAQITG